MFTFLFGKPKSGKTAYIMDRIRENIQKEQKTYLLVPEQQLFVSECMLRDLPPSSALYFEVIGFSRLCEIVFSQYGGVADAKIGSGVKNLVMWDTLRDLKHGYMQHDRIKNDAKFVQMMLSSIDELRANKITAEICEKAAEDDSDPLLSRKLDYLGAVYHAYTENLKKCVRDDELLSEDKLSRLERVLFKNKFFSDTEIFIDSFTDFTKEEFDVIKQMIKQAKQACMSFTYIRGQHAPHNKTLSDTVKDLTAFLREENIEYTDKILDKSSSLPSALDVIEQYLWNFTATTQDIPKLSKEDQSSVRSFVCENEFEEAWLCALNIISEHERGVKYSEMAVIARNPEDRRGIIEAVFEHAGIPYFFSEKTDLSATAPARLVLSALRCIYRNFNRSDVINLLKTGLCGIDIRDANLFEDYCNTWNINGKLFTQSEAWSMNADGYTTQKSDRGKEILRAANKVKSQLIPPLLALERDLKAAGGDTVKSCHALYKYIDKIDLTKNLSTAAEDAIKQGKAQKIGDYILPSSGIREAGELLRVYDFLISVLTDICTVMKDVSITPDMLYSAIEIMLKNTDIGSVPAINDCVTVGSAATLRVENIKVAMLLGLCEGEFPASYSDNGILTDSDKQKMLELKMRLTSREDKIISDELFYVYRAMTKPQQRLFISTCRSTVSGRALSPSVAFSRVHMLLPDLEIKTFDLNKIRMIAASQTAKGESGGSDESCEGADRTAINDGSVDEYSVTIDEKFVREYLGDDLNLSKSKITSFVECPYKYWCESGLFLREQDEAKISYDNAGTIIHYVLENLLKQQCNKDDGKISPLTDDELIDTVNALLDSYVSDIQCPMPPYMLHSFSRLRDLALIMAKSVMDEFKESSFCIVGFEKRIKETVDGALKPMKIRLGDNEDDPTVSLGGTIDRVDCYDDGINKYIRVIDYKTGSHTFSLKKVKTGEDVQLPAYLFTAALEQNSSIFGASSGEGLIPASALFLTAEEKNGRIDPVRRGFILSETDILNATNSRLDSKMLAGITFNKDGSLSKKNAAALDRDAIDELGQTLREVVTEVGRNIYSGKAPRTPSSSACKFCSVKQSCPVANKG